VASRAERMLTEDLDEKLEEAKDARLSLEPQWHENLAFYLGKQWLRWDPVRRRLMKPDVPPWRVLVTANFIQGVIRTEYAKMTKQKPTVGVQPRTNNPDDEAQARASEKILEYLWRQTGTHKATKRALLWALVTGTGVLKIFWDPTAGDEIDEGVNLGEIVVVSCSPFEIYPDPFGETLEEKHWLFHVKIHSADYVKAKYDADIDPEPVTGDEYAEAQVLNFTGDIVAGPRKGVVIKEYWERPSEEYPDGRYVVYARDQVLASGPNPYPRIYLPFVEIPHIPVPGRFWGESTVTFLKDIQRNYNKSRSQIIEIRNLMAKPKWLVPKGSIDRSITTAPAEIVDYTPVGGFKPEPVKGGDVSATYWRDLEQCRHEMYEISGQHEVSHAQVPGEVRSGIAIAYLQEQDDTRLNPTVQAYETAIEKLETYKLELARQFYAEPRTARIVGEENRAEVFEFSAEDIPENADVNVVAGSSLPQSRVAKQEFVLELWRDKLIQDPRKVLKLLEFGDVEGIYEDTNLDIGQAERENQEMVEGIPHEPEDFENHELHIYTHNKFRKSAEYDELDDGIKELFGQHVEMHEQFRLQALEQGAGKSGFPQALFGGAGGGEKAEAGYGEEVPSLGAALETQGG